MSSGSQTTKNDVQEADGLSNEQLQQLSMKRFAAKYRKRLAQLEKENRPPIAAAKSGSTTRRAAERLGLVKKARHVPFYMRQLSAAHMAMESLLERCSPRVVDFALVVDFETTCFEGDAKRGHTQEIIEFPAILLQISSGTVVSCFHSFVRPTFDCTLSAFCMQLTGITQEQVDKSPTLEVVVENFNSWLLQLQDAHNFKFIEEKDWQEDSNAKLALSVTWSDWDFLTCFPAEAKWKHIKIPSSFECWLDLKSSFRKLYDTPPSSLEEGMKSRGLYFEGRAHSGIVDAQNTAHLLLKMLSDGLDFKPTTFRNRLKPHQVALKSINEPELRQPVATTSELSRLQTAPFCLCSKRAKLGYVTTPGPTIGQSYFACAQFSKRLGSGCKFFAWTKD